MFSLLSKPFVVAWYDTSEEYLLVFGLLLLAALYGEFLAESNGKKHPVSNKQKRLFEENEGTPSTARPDSIFKKYKAFLGMMVVISVLGELLADGGIFAFGRKLQIISERENSIMALQVANIGTTNAQLVASNQVNEARIEELRSNNNMLEAQLNPRVIEISRPAARLKKYGGIQVAIVFGQFSDCGSLAEQIGAILQEADWNIANFFPTMRPVPDGVSIGLCSTNANWDEVLTPEAERLGFGFSPNSRSGFSIEDFVKLTGASDALNAELTNAGVDSKRNVMINMNSNLRFQGVFILIGPRLTPSEIKANIAEIEYSQASERIMKNVPVTNSIERLKQFSEISSNHWRAMLAPFTGTNSGGHWIIPGGKYP